MTDDRPPTIDRLYDLLAERAVRPLTAAEQRELESLLAKWPHVDPDDFDLAAAAVALTAVPDPEPLPPRLASAITADAGRFFDGVPPTVPSRPRRSVLGRIGWATAACLAGVLIWSNWPVPSLNNRRERVRPTAAVFTSDPGPAAGEVLWRQAEQDGFLEVRGLPPNDPGRSQYQLWVVDAGRKAQPHDRVDAGVFNVRPDGTALVPVRPALRVFDAAAFAVTEEPAGGVIVSQVPQTLRLLMGRR